MFHQPKILPQNDPKASFNRLDISKTFFYRCIILSLTKYKEINTKYTNDTEGSMLCHTSPAAYTYKGSFTLFAAPLKGREGHFEFRYRHCKTHMGARQRKKVAEGKNDRKR